MSSSFTLRSVLNNAGIGLALAALILLFTLGSDKFLSAQNITNIMTQISINLALAVGMTFVILIGGIDLSVGSILALAATLAGMVITREALSVHTAIALAVLTALVTGMACGIANGAISAIWRLPSFIVTLGMLNIARGGALTAANAKAIYSFPDSFNEFGSAQFLGIPGIFIVAFGLTVVAWFVLTRTVFGRMVYAIGNNEEAVRLAGHRTLVYKVAAFAICGLCAGIAAVIYMARLNIASPIAGIGFELNAIAAVVIGGTSINGGRGSVAGTFLGACIIGVLANGLILIGLNDFQRQMITGVVIVLAVIVDYYRARLSTV